MIEWMNAFALTIHRYRFILIIIGFLSFCSSLYIILNNDPHIDRYLMLSVILLAWTLCLFGVSNLFRRIPEPAENEVKFFRRQWQRFRRLIAWGLGAGLLTLCFALLYFTYKSIVLVVEGI